MRTVLSHAPRSARPGRTRRAALAAAVAAAALAWASPVGPQPDADDAPVLSYAEMAERLVGLYPGANDHALRIVRTVHREADRHGLDPCLVMGVIARESSFEPRARSREDLGLMQLNSRFHADLIERAGGPRAMLELEPNLRAGIGLLAKYRRMSADEREALQRYHGLGKRNGYVGKVTAEAERMRDAGACVPAAPTTVALN